MTAKLPFTKMQGAGNDYVYVNGFNREFDDLPELARKISDRHFGVGSDGLVLILPSDRADLRMRILNADGSEAEMCGNASRCVAKYAWDNGLIKKDVFSLETGAGIKELHLRIHDGEVESVTVDMGEPILQASTIPVQFDGMGETIVDQRIEVTGLEYFITAVSMGNPHAVLLMHEIDSLDLPAIGPGFENHPWFPRRTNTEFVEVKDPRHIRMRVWERGAGETLACGTGASAAVVACVLNNRTEREVEVELRGGTLQIRWDADDNHIYMTGPAVTVFSGEYIIGNN